MSGFQNALRSTAGGDKPSGEGFPRVLARRYSAESPMRFGAFDVMENLRCKFVGIASLVGIESRPRRPRGALGAASVANADGGTISIRIFKAGFIIGGSAGKAC